MKTTKTFRISTEQEAYLDQMMQKVSRSFALVVPFTEPPLNHYLATAYLLCRVIDNVEDCLQPGGWKRDRFSEVIRLLEEPQRASEVLSTWRVENWPALTVEEWQLMVSADAETLWQIYGNIPDDIRKPIRQWTRAMAAGLSQLDNPQSAPRFIRQAGVNLLATPADYNLYCYLVAGTVGYMSSELVIQHYGLSKDVANKLLITSEACGRALQKTNIIKDFHKDLSRGMCYLPDSWMREIGYRPLDLQGAPTEWSHEVIDNVVQELEDASDYIMALPYRAAGYRMASLLCLLPAYQTILLAAQRQQELFTPNHQFKISRETMAQCILDAQNMVADNDLIRQYGRRIEQSINSEFVIASPERIRVPGLNSYPVSMT